MENKLRFTYNCSKSICFLQGKQ